MRSPLLLEVLEDRSVPALLLTAGADPSQLIVTASSDAQAVTVVVTADAAWVGQILTALQGNAAALDALFAGLAATPATGSVPPTLIDPSAPPPGPIDPSDAPAVEALKTLLAPLAGPYGDFIRLWN